MIRHVDKYEIRSRIGRGGMGSVYRAWDPLLHREVALKIISAEAGLSDELRRRFFREAQACARLNHPNIITIHNIGEADDQLFIVMELLDGEDLHQIMAESRPMSLEQRLALVLDVCNGLHYAHRMGIIHRDVKPQNIVVLRNGQAKLVDFGIARLAAGVETNLTRTGRILGTPRYMAPEQVRGRADHRSDIFALGAVCYELFGHRRAFPGEDAMEILEQLRAMDPPPLAEIDPDLPPELSAIVTRALQKDPDRRFGDLGEMHAALERLSRARAEAAERGRDGFRRRLGDLRRVQESLERLGGDAGPWRETPPEPPAGAPLTVIEAAERDVEASLARAAALATRLEALQSDIDGAGAALARGEFHEAVAAFERVLETMPEHAGARAGLGNALRSRDEHGRRTRIASLMAEAAAALDRRAHAQCLAALDGIVEIAEPGEAPEEMPELRRAAKAGQAAEREARGVSPPKTGAGPQRPLGPARREGGPRRRRLLAGSIALLGATAAGWLCLSSGVALSFRSAPDELAPLRAETARARQEAVAAEADRLAPGALAEADARAEEGDRLAAAHKSAQAEPAYRAARERYAEAAREADSARPARADADRARERMFANKGAADPGTPGFEAALARQREGAAKYEAGAFREAAEHFAAAADLLAAARREPPPAAMSPGERPDQGRPRADARAEIRTLLEDYVRAVEAKNAGAMRRLRPGLTDQDMSRMRSSFAIKRGHKIELTIYQIAIRGDEAEALGKRQDDIVLNDGQRVHTESAVSFALERRENRWVIRGIQEARGRQASR